jgi:multidrug efflux system outer membrane protein
MRYEAGTANLVELLESERSLAAADQALVLARLGELLNRLALYKALGGEERAAS